MNLEQLRARLAEIVAEMEGLTSAAPDTDLEGEPAERFAALTVEATDIRGQVGRIEDRQRQAAEVRAVAQAIAAGDQTRGEVASAPTVIRKAGDPFDLDTLGATRSVKELRARATTAIEKLDYMADEARQEATRKVNKVKDPKGVIAGLVLRTSHPDYVEAFAATVEAVQRGQSPILTPEQHRAMREVDEYRTFMGLTDGNGGYAIPAPVDPSIILTNAGSNNPVRRIARVVTITGDVWKGLSSAGVSASFDAEGAEVSDDSPTFAQPEVQTRMARAFAAASIEVAGDFPNLAGELATMFADAKDNLESLKFWSGASASNEPIGIETALNGGSSEVAQTTGEAMTVADIYKTQQALPARYQGKPGTAWTAELSTINFMRQFATANNYHAFLTDLGGGNPPRLLGYDLHEWSSMDKYSAVDAAATAVNHLLLIGDWANYLVADRVGGTIEFIPHLFHTTTNLPSFNRGWVYYWRVGADSINDAGFRLYTLTTAA